MHFLKVDILRIQSAEQLGSGVSGFGSVFIGDNLTGFLAAVGYELTGLDSWNTFAGLPALLGAGGFVFALFGRTSQQTCIGAIGPRQLRHGSPGCGAYGFHCGGGLRVFLFSTVAGSAHAGIELSDTDCADGISGRRS